MNIRNEFKKILLLVLLSLMYINFGCSSSQKVFNVSFEGKGGFGFDEDALTYTISKYISSKEDLVQLCKKMNNGFFDEASNSYNSEIGKIIRNYDDVFFIKNSIIICVIDAGNHFNYSFKNLKVNDNIITLNIRKKKKFGAYTDEAFPYLFIIEVENSHFTDINSVEIMIK